MNFCVYMSDLILLLSLDEYEYEYYYGELNNDIVNETITLNVEGRIIMITKLIYYIYLLSSTAGHIRSSGSSITG